MSDEERFQRSGDVLSTPFEDDLLMMSVDLGKYFMLDGVARRIWEMLEYPTPPGAIVRQLMDEYDVNMETCETQVDDFLKRLRERGLLADVA